MEKTNENPRTPDDDKRAGVVISYHYVGPAPSAVKGMERGDNLSATQRLWKRRRERWAAFKAGNRS